MLLYLGHTNNYDYAFLCSGAWIANAAFTVNPILMGNSSRLLSLLPPKSIPAGSSFRSHGNGWLDPTSSPDFVTAVPLYLDKVVVIPYSTINALSEAIQGNGIKLLKEMKSLKVIAYYRSVELPSTEAQNIGENGDLWPDAELIYIPPDWANSFSNSTRTIYAFQQGQGIFADLNLAHLALNGLPAPDDNDLPYEGDRDAREVFSMQGWPDKEGLYPESPTYIYEWACCIPPQSYYYYENFAITYADKYWNGNTWFDWGFDGVSFDNGAGGRIGYNWVITPYDVSTEDISPNEWGLEIFRQTVFLPFFSSLQYADIVVRATGKEGAPLAFVPSDNYPPRPRKLLGKVKFLLGMFLASLPSGGGTPLTDDEGGALLDDEGEPLIS